MNNDTANKKMTEKFQLSKWFLDYIGQDGETMIFYSARLHWYFASVDYTSCLQYRLSEGVKSKYRFSWAQMPQVEGNRINWADKEFGISGSWEARADKIETRIFESDEGYLDWKCYQPASNVHLQTTSGTKEGRGYAEQLILTVPPWKIPMDELRWGRFNSDAHHLVWIELKEKEIHQWLWLNGEKLNDVQIGDDKICIAQKQLVLSLDQSVILESEKKISSVVEQIVRYIPGFNKLMPLNFLMADEKKWLSNALLKSDGMPIAQNFAIHELVNFKASNP